MDRTLRWFEMPVGQQLANVGGEINRAIRWKNKHEKEKELSFLDKAMEFLKLTMQDPKNKNRLGELYECKREIDDFFFEGNTYSNTDESLMKFYNSFL